MGRPLSKQQFFNANAKNNIKVQFHNGTASVRGYIVEQTGSKRFKCKDENGVIRICRLVDKASANLLAGEMSITVKYDNGTAQQITKIARHRVTVDGTIQPWSFSTSTSDGKVQMEEAGTNAAMASSTDLELDEGPTIPPGMDRNEPYAGSGGATPAVPGTPIDGLYRRKYVGNFSTTYIDEASYEFNVGFMKPANGPISEAAYEVDTYGGFGLRTDLDDENGYAFEWKGYIQAPATGNFNFFSTVDDDCIIWIGTPATATTLGDTTSDYLFAQSGNTRNNGTVGVAMTANKWYPIRIWFQEWAGAEKFQLGASNSANGTLYGLGGTNFAFKHNSVTKGY